VKVAVAGGVKAVVAGGWLLWAVAAFLDLLEIEFTSTEMT